MTFNYWKKSDRLVHFINKPFLMKFIYSRISLSTNFSRHRCNKFFILFHFRQILEDECKKNSNYFTFVILSNFIIFYFRGHKQGKKVARKLELLYFPNCFKEKQKGIVKIRPMRCSSMCSSIQHEKGKPQYILKQIEALYNKNQNN